MSGIVYGLQPHIASLFFCGSHAQVKLKGISSTEKMLSYAQLAYMEQV